jgi:dihydrofolate reductase
MAKVTADLTMTLDGFIAGPDDSLEHPLGVGGERIHKWVYGLEIWRKPQGLSGGAVNEDTVILEESSDVGAHIVGRRMFDVAQEWGDEPPFHKPVFVVTHRPHNPIPKQGGTTFTFVTDGIESALRQALAAADGKDVSIGGGANLIQQFVKARLIDELQIHVASVLLGSGTRLFDDISREHIELNLLRVVEGKGVAHLKYRIVK